MKTLTRLCRAPLALEIVLPLAIAACSDSTSGIPTTQGAGGMAGAVTGAGVGTGGQAGVSTTGATTTSGTATGGTSGTAGSGLGGAAGASGGAGPADGSVDGPRDGTVPCPGAGMSLHFQDDVAGATISTQVLADLGADLPIGNAARTIEMWLYMEGNQSWKSEHSIVEYGGQGRCQAFGIDGGDNGTNNPAQFDPFTFSAGGPCAGDDNVSITPAPPRTGWLHLAWVYDPTASLAYSGQTNLNFLFTVNGVPQPIPAMRQTGAGLLLTMRTLVSIGSGQITNNGFTGRMDEFRFWNVARTSTEIADNYQLILKGDEPGLVAYYHFDDGTGTTVRDSSTKQHNATFASDGGRPIPTWVDSTGLVLTCKP
jgi:Concanavalin A-like lectin/glucanases superfamily